MKIEKTTLLIILQGMAIVLQMINSQMAVLTDDKATALVISAVIGGFQYIVQHLGNQACPPSISKGEPVCLPKDSQGSSQQ